MTKENMKSTLRRVIVTSLISSLIFPTLILLLAGDWLWIEGWIFGLWLDAMVVSNIVYLYRHDPALMAERSKKPGSDNQKSWDKFILSFSYIGAVVWLVIMPLDATRFSWSPAFPVWLKILGGVALLPALFLIFKATVENTYLSTLVRIQDDRDQHVIRTGVYSFVRHPLYLGCLLMLLGAPLLLGSIYSLIIFIIAVIVLVIRIYGEEKMLTTELEGYEEYKKNVRYRLIPFIW